jgi:signal peptidase II
MSDSRIDRKWPLFVIVTVVATIADQVTKIWARTSLPVIGHGSGPGGKCVVPADIVHRMCIGDTKTVIGGFWNWRLSMNPGSAFGLFSSQDGARIFLSIVGIAAVIGMIYMLRKSRSDQLVLHWALALVAGGAIGNLIDRIQNGVVTDFVLWHLGSHEWPVFNVADVVLVIGVGLMFIDIQIENRRAKTQRAVDAQDERERRARAAGLVKDL